LEQITSTRPLRRMILHFSHIGLTEGRTFTLALSALGRSSIETSFLSGALEAVAVAATPLKVGAQRKRTRCKRTEGW
jgi:hypothetical protein